MFVGRTKELRELESLYAKATFDLVFVYGRRRVGKTTLINEFTKGKNTVFYTAAEVVSSENLRLLSRSMLGSDISFPSYDALFAEIGKRAQAERLVFVIDEYPYLAHSESSVSSLIQKYIDTEWKDTHLMLILSGSSMSFMENQLQGYQSPLYGRRTAQFKILPFTYFEAREMLQKYSDEDAAVLYAVTGGIPDYLSAIDSGKGVDENIQALMFKPSGRLYEETSNLLKQELRDPSSYNAVIAAIANGCNRVNEISDSTHLQTSAVSAYLSSLIGLGIVGRETPVTEPVRSRKSIYVFNDSYFRFWYRFVFGNQSMIERGYGTEVFDAFVKKELSNFMGPIFERISLDFLFTERGFPSLPFLPERIGRWWGNNPLTKREDEIDIVAVSSHCILLSECKWHASPVDRKVLQDLILQGNQFAHPEKSYIVFSKSGFTASCEELARKQAHVQLISFQSMCKGKSLS